MSWQIRNAEQRLHMVLVTLSVAGHEWAKRAEHVQVEMAMLRADLERLQLAMLKQRRLERDALSKQRRLERRSARQMQARIAMGSTSTAEADIEGEVVGASGTTPPGWTSQDAGI